DRIADRADLLLERRLFVVAVEIPDVDVFRSQALQAGVELEDEPLAAAAARVGVAGDARALHLGREHPPVAVPGDGLAGDALGVALAVGVGRVDEVAAGFERGVHYARRHRLVGALAEHHRAEADLRHFQSARAEASVVHTRGEG